MIRSGRGADRDASRRAGSHRRRGGERATSRYSSVLVPEVPEGDSHVVFELEAVAHRDVGDPVFGFMIEIWAGARSWHQLAPEEERVRRP